MIFNSYAEGKEELSGIRLVSCGHIFAKPGREIYRPNGRDDWLLFYVAKEEETFYTDKAETASAGSFIIYAPEEKQHHVYSGNKTAEFYYVHFQCKSLPRGIKLDSSRVYSVGAQKVFSAVFEEIIEETLEKKPHYELLAISRLIYLFSLIERHILESECFVSSQSRSVARAVQHMNRYFDSNLKLEDYADMCCISKYHFARIFKEVTGSTPLSYRNRIRIEHAKEMLKNGYLSISEISDALGFASAAYFSDSFKKTVGVSPMEYKHKS